MLTGPEEIARKAPPGNCRRLYDGSAVEYCPDADPVAECKQLAVDYLHANLTKRALKEIPSLTWRIVQECFWREQLYWGGGTVEWMANRTRGCSLLLDESIMVNLLTDSL